MVSSSTAAAIMTLIDLTKSVKTASEDIGMRFGMDKCTALRMKREKHRQCEGTVLGQSMMIGEAN